MQCSQEELTTLAVSYCNATVHSKCSHGKCVFTFTVFTIVYTTSIRLLCQSFGKGGQLSYSGEDHFPTQGWAAALLKCRQLPNSSVGSFLTQVWAPHIAAVLFVSAQLFYLWWCDAVLLRRGHQAHSSGQLSIGLESA
jgi:hypothetical protein